LMQISKWWTTTSKPSTVAAWPHAAGSPFKPYMLEEPQKTK
jgi:hypothetical protein